MHDVAVVGSDALFVALRMADDVLFGQAVLFAEVSAQFHRFLVNGIKIRGMIRLNDTGAFLWEQCRKETTKEQVLQAMAEKYEVDESVAADDLDRFLQQLRNAEILEETNE